MRKVNKIIWHCADTDIDIGVKQIREWHKVKGFTSPSGEHCGYHYIIRKSGTIEVGRIEEEAGEHCAGENHDSLGICLVARLFNTDKQLDGAKQLTLKLLEKYCLTPFDVYGHRDFNNAKSCPNCSTLLIRAYLTNPNF